MLHLQKDESYINQVTITKRLNTPNLLMLYFTVCKSLQTTSTKTYMQIPESRQQSDENFHNSQSRPFNETVKVNILQYLCFSEGLIVGAYTILICSYLQIYCFQLLVFPFFYYRYRLVTSKRPNMN